MAIDGCDDSATSMSKSVVISLFFDWGIDRPPWYIVRRVHQMKQSGANSAGFSESRSLKSRARLFGLPASPDKAPGWTGHLILSRCGVAVCRR
jgi:hypothetical protein